MFAKWRFTNMNRLKHPLYSVRNWVFVFGLLVTALLMVYPLDVMAGRVILGLLGINLLYGWRRNWIQHLSALRWFDDMSDENKEIKNDNQV